MFISLTVSSQGIGKRTACQVPIRSVFSSWQESREQLEGRSTQQPCQMPAVFIEENARIPSYPATLLLRVSLSCKMGKHAENTAMLSVLFLGAKMISGHYICVDYEIWPHQLLGLAPARKFQGRFLDYVTREDSKARLHHPVGYPAFGQEVLTVTFCPSLHHVFRLSVCNSYYASLDISTRMAISTSRAMRELM